VRGLHAAIAREQVLLALAMAAVVGFGGIYVWEGAGMGMPAWDMTTTSLFPHRQHDVPGDMGGSWWLLVSMWWVMMVAMMTPGAAPLVLLHSRVLMRHDSNAPKAAASSSLLLAGYLVTWLGFSVLAAALQRSLQPSGLLSAMMWWSRSAWFSAALLFAAGTYQWSPWKHACLSQCRNPVSFLTAHARAGLWGAFALGVRHGAYCVGCCGLLMALLFVGGVMNVLWITALAILVLCEKLLPKGLWIGRASGALLMIWAVATLLV
jgi:predicted metal-binding membrane protein